jgi:hypothetical protein
MALTLLAIAGCQAQGFPPQPAAPAPKAPPLISGGQASGRQILEAYQYCQAQAYAQCSRDTIRCDSFRAGYIKSCLILQGVPAEHVFLLTHR